MPGLDTALALAAPVLPDTVERYCLTPELMLPGHRFQLLLGGGEAYPAMLEAIAAAREELLLETYFWASDLNGRRFIDAVCIKAQEGVPVRCIIDGAGSFRFAGQDLARLREAGVKLSVFHPVGPWRRRWGWQVRDHRKLLIIDRRVAFAGGMNLANEYAPLDWGGQGWNDVHVRLEGPVVAELTKLFQQSWQYASPETWSPGPARKRKEPRPEALPVAIPGATTRVQALAVGRFLGRRTIQRHLSRAISAARERLYVQAAYFIPNRGLRTALKKAAERGVDVRVMMPRALDVWGLQGASRYTWATLLRSGVQLYEWLPGMLHAKTMTADGCWCTVGSYNLDQRSLLYNWEVTLGVLDPAVAATLEKKFVRDLAQCERVDPDSWKHRGLWNRVRERFFYFFRLWL